MAASKKDAQSPVADNVEFIDFAHTSNGPGAEIAAQPVAIKDISVDPAVIDALAEIQREAAQAKHAMAFIKSDTPESVEIPDAPVDTSLSTEEQEEQKRNQDELMLLRLRKRAARQRELGLLQLTTAPTRRGDMELVRKVQVFDVPISNMVKRFVSIADRLISRLHGFGALIMGEEKAAISIEILTGYIDEMHRYAKTLHEHTKTAMQTHMGKQSAAGEEWISPHYARTALDVEVHLMRREGNKMLESFLLYDKSIELLRVLEWNDGTDPDQIDDIVNRARKQGSKIFRAALAGQMELGRRLQKRGGDTLNTNGDSQFTKAAPAMEMAGAA